MNKENEMSLAKKMIDEGKASPELIAAYSLFANGEYEAVIQAHRKTVKRGQTRERVRRLRERNAESMKNAKSALHN